MRNKLIIIGVICLLLVLGGWFYATQRAGQIKITLNSVPGEATIKINGEVSGRGTKYLKPGTYRFQAEKQGFAPTEQNYDLTTDDEGLVIDLLLQPTSEEAIAWAESNVKLYQEAEDRGALRALEEGSRERQQYPILAKLPYTSTRSGFAIGYRYDDQKRLLITIRGFTSLERQLALGQIERWGYDPADYRLDFVEFDNPLGEQL